MIKTEVNFKINDDDDFELRTKVTTNNLPVIEENYFKKLQSHNGFSDERTIQHIACYPYIIELIAKQNGIDLDDQKERDAFLKANPEFLCSNPFVTPGSNSHRIIIK